MRRFSESRSLRRIGLDKEIKIQNSSIQNSSILHVVIDWSLSAFIPNRLIIDNIIVGYECLYKMRHSKGKKRGLVKAYDMGGMDVFKTYYD